MRNSSILEGYDRLNKKFASLPGALQAAIKEAQDKSADETVFLLKSKIPKSEDAPHVQMTVERIPGRHELQALVAIGSEELPYAPALEFGHMLNGVFIKPQPYFIPVYRYMAKRHQGRINRAIRTVIKQVWETDNNTNVK